MIASHDSDRLAAMMRGKPALEDRLIGRGSIVGVGVGSQRAGENGDLAYLIYHDRRSATFTGQSEAPDTLDGYPTRMVEVEVRREDDPEPGTEVGEYDQVYDPLVGGIKITTELGASTLGTIVKRTDFPGEQYILTCGHCLDTRSSAVYQPSRSTDEDNLCAQRSNVIYGNFPIQRHGQTVRVHVDIGLAEVDEEKRGALKLMIAPADESIQIVGYPLINEALKNAVVHKIGFVTGKTEGYVSDIALTTQGRDGVLYRNVIVVKILPGSKAFGVSGDSGSIVYAVAHSGGSDHNLAIGLLDSVDVLLGMSFVTPVDAIMQISGAIFTQTGAAEAFPVEAFAVADASRHDPTDVR